MDSKYLHALNLILKPGNDRLETLVGLFGSGEAIWNAPENDILFSADLTQKTKDLLLEGRHSVDPNLEWKRLLLSGISFLSKSDPSYPELLREASDSPYVLYARGTYDWSGSRPLIAIVGSRKYTSYGERAAYRLGEDLARAGCIVVSGLAYGIDALAHEAALETGMETLAVMGNGLDDASLYPRNNVSLAQKIAGHGALISEYPPGTQANSYTFPMRNRIIAGMSLGVVVIEAAEESGSLITAKLALDYNREVFAVPGSIFSPVSIGTNKLIKEGAKIVTSVQDILEEFPIPIPQKSTGPEAPTAAQTKLSLEEQKVLSCLSHEPLHVDKIIQAATLETAAVNSILSMLEIKGFARNIGGMNYIRI
jgi:DNA processing protein